MKIGSTNNQAFTGKLQVNYRTIINGNLNIPSKMVQMAFDTTQAQDKSILKALAELNPKDLPDFRSRINEGIFAKIRGIIKDNIGIDLEHLSIDNQEYNLATEGEKNLHINRNKQIIVSDGGLLERSRLGHSNAMEIRYSFVA